jgi:hypothetical protein
MERPRSKGQVDRAGKLLRAGLNAASEDAYSILSSWRAFHAYPLNAVATTLRNRALVIDANAVVAQRLKRFSSIRAKLLDKEAMALTQMQDIAGCRAVVNTVDDVYRLKQIYLQYAVSRPEKGPELVNKWTKDYIFQPKEDGYRSVHLVMKYRTKSQSASHCNGLRVEIQIRSRMQHAWAMAVETASSLTDQALKAGRGRDTWKKFFRYMASAIALEENLPLVPYTPEDEWKLYAGIRELAHELRVIALFEGMSRVVRDFKQEIFTEIHPRTMFLLELDAEKRNINTTAFGSHELKEAVAMYAHVERQHAANPNDH